MSGSNGTRMLYESKKLQPFSPLRTSSFSSSSSLFPSNKQPVLSMGLKVGHKTPGSSPSTPPTTTTEEPNADFTDHHVVVKLQQMVFIFDKQTTMKLAAMAALLFKNFNAE